MTNSVAALRVEDRAEARWIVFDRPDKLNTLKDEDLAAATKAVIEACELGRAVVFTGAGERAFSAGMNLDVFLDILDDPARTRATMQGLKFFLDAVRRAEVPTIAAVNGHCLGAAFELALVCDFRIAVPNALLGLPEIKLGVPCILDSAILGQYVGLNRAKEMILTGSLHQASEMHHLGLLRLAPTIEELRPLVNQLLSELRDHSPVGVASQKRLFEIWQNNGLDRANELSIDEVVEVFGDAETRRRLLDFRSRLRGDASRNQ